MSDDDAAALAVLRKHAEVAIVDMLRIVTLSAVVVWALGLVRGVLVAALIIVSCRVVGALVLRGIEYVVDRTVR